MKYLIIGLQNTGLRFISSRLLTANESVPHISFQPPWFPIIGIDLEKIDICRLQMTLITCDWSILHFRAMWSDAQNFSWTVWSQLLWQKEKVPRWTCEDVWTSTHLLSISESFYVSLSVTTDHNYQDCWCWRNTDITSFLQRYTIDWSTFLVTGTSCCQKSYRRKQKHHTGPHKHLNFIHPQ